MRASRERCLQKFRAAAASPDRCFFLFLNSPKQWSRSPLSPPPKASRRSTRTWPRAPTSKGRSMGGRIFISSERRKGSKKSRSMASNVRRLPFVLVAAGFSLPRRRPPSAPILLYAPCSSICPAYSGRKVPETEERRGSCCRSLSLACSPIEKQQRRLSFFAFAHLVLALSRPLLSPPHHVATKPLATTSPSSPPSPRPRTPRPTPPRPAGSRTLRRCSALPSRGLARASLLPVEPVPPVPVPLLLQLPPPRKPPPPPRAPTPTPTTRTTSSTSSAR